MQRLGTIALPGLSNTRQIELCIGDLASIPPEQAVDLLIVSAFPDDYIPTKTSLIGALHRAGVSVAELALNKAIDLRKFSACWVSHPIQKANINFKRLVCFEPAYRGSAPEVVGDIFRCLVPLAAGPGGFSSVAMPLVASGDQGESPAVMLKALLDAAVLWLQHGLSLERICIVIRDGTSRNELIDIFDRAKQANEAPREVEARQYKYDVFVSYAHKDKSAWALVEAIKKASPELRLFVDRFELNPGAAWQDRIYQALAESRRIVCAYSPAYLDSKVCNEEFNLGNIRRRDDDDDDLLLPVYLRSASLPLHMKQFQYIDAREEDSARISAAAIQLVEMIR